MSDAIREIRAYAQGLCEENEGGHQLSLGVTSLISGVDLEVLKRGEDIIAGLKKGALTVVEWPVFAGGADQATVFDTESLEEVASAVRGRCPRSDRLQRLSIVN